MYDKGADGNLTEDEVDKISARTTAPEDIAKRFNGVAGGIEASVYLDFAANEYLDYYEIDAGPYYGSGDITSEHIGHYAERDNTVDTKDFQLIGSPYVYKKQVNPLTGVCTDVKDATNRMDVYFVHDYAPLAAGTKDTGLDADGNRGTGRLKSPGWRSGWYDGNNSVTTGAHRYWDEAYYLGYLIPYGYKYSLQAVTTDANGNTDMKNGKPSENGSLLYDYYLDDANASWADAANNVLPNTAKFFAYFQNISDGGSAPTTASHISRVKLENTLDSAFRLQTIYVPQQFVEVASNSKRYADWFRGESFTFRVYDAKSSASKDITLTWNIL